MKNFKIIAQSFGVGLLLFGVAYLMGAFANVAFNIEYWSQDARTGISIFGGLLGLVFGTGTFLYIKNNQSKPK